jgi:Las1-like
MKNASVRVVPWTDWNEWATLRAQLQHGDLTAAAATVTLYRLRRPAALPLALEATVSLRTLLVRGSRVDDHTRRLGLAMALVRLVNGVTDRIQPRADGASARSVHSLARALALPPVLVELRHQATHNALPRLDALEDAACLALNWLEAEYWGPQARAVGLPDGLLPPPPPPPFPLAPASGTVEGAGFAKKRKRWDACDSTEDWRDVPIGLMPGENKAVQLIGIDVSAIIGERWRPTGVADEDPESAAEATGDGGYQGQSADAADDDDAGARRGAKAQRVLSDAEKSAVEQMMRELNGEGDV